MCVMLFLFLLSANILIQIIVDGKKLVARAYNASYSNGEVHILSICSAIMILHACKIDGMSVNARLGGIVAAEARSLRAQGKLEPLTEEQKEYNHKHRKRAKHLQETRRASSDPDVAAQAKAKDERTRVYLRKWRQKQKAQRTAAPVQGTDAPMEGTTAPVEGAAAAVEGAALVGGTTAPVGSTAAPVEGTAVPMEGTSVPVVGTASPVGDTSTPVEGTAAPEGGTAAPVGGTAKRSRATTEVRVSFVPKKGGWVQVGGM